MFRVEGRIVYVRWFALIFASFSSSALADREIEVLIVGAHIEESASVDALLNVADTFPGVSAVGPEQVKGRIRGRGPRIVDDALLTHGRSLLSEGRVLFEHADLSGAKERIAASVAAFEKAMPGSTDARPLVEALLVQGNIGLAMGDREAGRHAFRQVVRMDPDRLLDPVHYPPKVLALFDEVRSEMSKRPTGSIRVVVDDELASVHIDGRFVGVGSRVVDSLPSGPHHVLVSGSGGRRTYAAVNVESGRKLEFHASLESYFIGQPADTEREREIQTSSLYRSLGDQATEGLVLIAGETGVDEVGVQLYEPRTGNFSTVVRRSSDGDALGALEGMLPRVFEFLTPDGNLAPTAVSTDALGLDLSSNPALSKLLLQVEADRSARVPVGSQMPRAGSQPVPWGVWAGAGGMIVTATVVALLLRPDESSTGGDSKSTGTGTVTVEF